MTQTQTKIQQSRKRRIRREMARDVASQIATVLDFQGRPDSESGKLDLAARKMFALLNIFISCNLDIAPQFLRMVADALEGKLHAPKFDNAIANAHWKARTTGKRKDERSNLSRPLLSEVDDALTFVLTEMGYKKQPHKDALRRRLKILGLRLSEKQGRHRKKKATARP
jgi:hypothetical protein